MKDTEKNQLVLVAEKSNLPQNRIQDLMKSFTGYFDEARQVVEDAGEIVVTDESQTDLMLKAREFRLKLKEIRVNAEKTRVALKEQSLREGKAIDGIYNVIEALIVPVEKEFEKQEKFIESLEADRLEKKLAERIETLTPFVDDISFYTLKDMSDEAFANLLASCKAAYEAKKAAEEKVEKERLEKEQKEREENEKIRKDNEKLLKERQIQQEKIEKERKEQQEKLAKAQGEKQEAENKLKAEKEEQLRKEREVAAAELEKKKAEEETKRQELLAPDKEKLLKLANGMDLVKLPVVESREAGLVIEEVKKRVSEMATYIREEASKL